MAKKSYTHGMNMDVDCAMIGILPDMNYRQDYGDQKINDVLCHSIAQRGWLRDKPTKLILASESQAERARVLREGQWDAMQKMAAAANTADAKHELEAWETTYVRKGKIPTPEFVNIITFRRFSQLAKANYLRLSGKAASSDEEGKVGMMLPAILEIPSIICVFSNPADFRIEQIQENLIDAVGRKATTPVEILNGLKTVFEYTEKSTDFQRALTGGTEKGRSLAQKYLGILKCDRLYPEVMLMDRLNRKEGEPGFIPLDKLHKECVRVCGDGQLWKERDISCTTPLQVLEWHISQIVSGKPPKAKPMLDRETIGTMSTNSPNEVTQDMMNGVKDANIGMFGMYSKYALAFNALRAHAIKDVDPVNLAAYVAKFDATVIYKS